jgi:hypothetical protein
MKIEDLKELRKKAYENYNRALSELNIRFALINSSTNIGDVFTDHIGSIRVEKLSVYLSLTESGIPSMIYSGLVLKKDGTPTKKQDRRVAYQINSIIKPPINI